MDIFCPKEECDRNMEFYNFFDILWTYLAEPVEHENKTNGRPQFLLNLIDLIIRTPQTDIEDKEYKNGDLNPLSNKQLDTLNKYCSGARAIPKKVAADILKKLSNGEKFIKEIDFASSEAKNNIRDKLRSYQFDVNSSSLGKTCFKIMKAFLERLKVGKGTVKSSDINTEQESVNSLKLIQDVNSKCPLCQQDLIKASKANAIPNYDIVYIFPNNLDVKEKEKFIQIKKAPENPDTLENKIPLCFNCANSYINYPNVEDYKTLVQLKENISKENKISSELNQLTLENELTEVIKRLKTVEPNEKKTPIKYDAHKVEEKIKNDYPLSSIVKYYVVSYYNKIRNLFSNLENDNFSFDELAGTIKLAYLKFKREKLSQEAIFNRLAHWILEKEKLSDDYFEAARIVVAFFVQNCEVFEFEASK